MKQTNTETIEQSVDDEILPRSFFFSFFLNQPSLILSLLQIIMFLIYLARPVITLNDDESRFDSFEPGWCLILRNVSKL